MTSTVEVLAYSEDSRIPDRVAPADYSAGAPTEPYVHTVTHTALRSIVIYATMSRAPQFAVIRCCFVDKIGDV